MSTRLTTGLLSCLMMSFLVGCASSPDLAIRGQSPAGYPVQASANYGGGMPVLTSYNGEACAVDSACESGMCQDPSCYYGDCNNGYCHDGSCWGNCFNRCNDCPYCHGHGCQHCNQQYGPTHLYHHMYRIPQGMVYPQNPTPAAITVYPYYTHKGPDDFFYPPLKK